LKAIHGGKTKNDRIDSFKIAALLRGGNFPLAYNYPAHVRATRDLLRRRMYLSRRCGELVAHIQNTNTQSEQAKNFVERLTKKHNKGKALGILTHKLGRAIFFMLKNNEAFNMNRFFSS